MIGRFLIVVIIDTVVRAGPGRHGWCRSEEEHEHQGPSSERVMALSV